MTNVDLINPSY